MSIRSECEVMTFENILLEKKNAIAYVTVNRPKVPNALLTRHHGSRQG